MDNNFKLTVDVDRESILKRWRGRIMMHNLEEGSEEEWMCAKSLDVFSLKLLGIEDDHVRDDLALCGYPFIRRAFNELKSEIDGEAVFRFLHDVTIREVSEYYDKKDTEHKRIKDLQRLLSNLGKMDDLGLMSIIDFLMAYGDVTNDGSDTYMLAPIKRIKKLLWGVFDLYADILAASVEYFCYGWER